MKKSMERPLVALRPPPGYVVQGDDPRACGHSPEAHGRDPEYPGSSSCLERRCDCIAYESAVRGSWV
jgi:hypothetical protein